MSGGVSSWVPGVHVFCRNVGHSAPLTTRTRSASSCATPRDHTHGASPVRHRAQVGKSLAASIWTGLPRQNRWPHKVRCCSRGSGLERSKMASSCVAGFLSTVCPAYCSSSLPTNSRQSVDWKTALSLYDKVGEWRAAPPREGPTRVDSRVRHLAAAYCLAAEK